MKILNEKLKFSIILKFLFSKIKILIFFLLFYYCTKKINNKSKIIPKISIFLPIYNKNKYLLKSIGSIQKQTLKDIEIIGVNDYSTDNSLYTLKKLSKIDTRIKIVNNDRNHGLLYTRTMGILNSTGEYIMNLDPDDEFKEKNNLEILYKIAKYNKVDILNFAYIYENKTLLKCKNNYKIIKRPKLFQSAFNDKYSLNDYLIWNKLIKRKLMLKAYEIYKKKIYSHKWNYHDDNIWSILIYRYGNSMKCINNTIYIYNSLNDSLMKNIQGSYIEIKNLIYKVEILSSIFKEKIYYKYILSEYKSIIYRINTKYQILKNKFDIRRKFIKLLILCIKLYKCSNNIINNIIKFIFLINS